MSRARLHPATRIVALAGLAAAVCAGGTSAAGAAPSARLCVGAKPGCFATVQAAVDAAHDGDTIELGIGTFQGGVTIDKSVEVVGVSAAATIIRGGGPVVTIGEFAGANELQVAISRVTITGGVNDTAGLAAGGGIWIPQSTGRATGAAVTIADSVITGNRAAPKATFSSPAPCGIPFDECAFALGGGIANAGRLTLTDTRVSDNVAGSAATTSSASGGGITNGRQGTLTLIRSTVSGNRAQVDAPNGRFTFGGGISSDGALTLDDSVVSGNTSAVATSMPSFFPFDVEQEANAGGIYLPAGSFATIRGSRITGNSVGSSNTAGDVEAESGGIDADGSLLLIDSSVDHNTVTGTVPAVSGLLVETDSGGIQVQGDTILRNSRISDNTVTATSAAGTAIGAGGAINNLSADLTLERTVVTGNAASATGVAGFNLGGGISNVAFNGPVPQLTLTDSVIAGNRLIASAGIASHGGGLYTTDPFGGGPFPVTLARTVIAGNRPDQCVGC